MHQDSSANANSQIAVYSTYFFFGKYYIQLIFNLYFINHESDKMHHIINHIIATKYQTQYLISIKSPTQKPKLIGGVLILQHDVMCMRYLIRPPLCTYATSQ